MALGRGSSELSGTRNHKKRMDTNGLCLNGLHDKAFDRGFMTVDERYVIHISDDIADVIDGSAVDRYFKYYNGEKIILPDRFMPSRKYLQYHNDVIITYICLAKYAKRKHHRKFRFICVMNLSNLSVIKGSSIF